MFNFLPNSWHSSQIACPSAQLFPGSGLCFYYGLFGGFSPPTSPRPLHGCIFMKRNVSAPVRQKPSISSTICPLQHPILPSSYHYSWNYFIHLYMCLFITYYILCQLLHDQLLKCSNFKRDTVIISPCFLRQEFGNAFAGWFWVSCDVALRCQSEMQSSGGLTGACCCCLVAWLCPTLCDPMDCSTPGFPVLHHLQELAQTHVHWFSDAIQPSHSLLSPSPPVLSLSQHQDLF